MSGPDLIHETFNSGRSDQKQKCQRLEAQGAFDERECLCVSLEVEVSYCKTEGFLNFDTDLNEPRRGL